MASRRNSPLDNSMSASYQDESSNYGCFSCFLCSRKSSRASRRQVHTPIPTAFNTSTVGTAFPRNNSGNVLLQSNPIESSNIVDEPIDDSPISTPVVFSSVGSKWHHRSPRHGHGGVGGAMYKYSSDTISSYKSADEPCAIHFVEISENYDNVEWEDEEEPLGFKSGSDNNYLACVIQALFCCKKFVTEMIDYGIHLGDEKSPHTYFSRKIRDAFIVLEEKKRFEVQRCITLVQNGLNNYPYKKSLATCFLAIFYKIENEHVADEDSYSYIKEESIVETSHEVERFFVDNFYSRIAQTVTCRKCDETISRSVQYLRIIPIYIRNPSAPFIVNQCVDEFFDETDIERTEDQKCSCNNGVLQRKVTLVKGPEFMIVCLKETTESLISSDNILYDRDLFITVNKEGVKYCLIGVIDKNRSQMKCFNKSCFDSNDFGERRWWIFNDDDMISSISETHFPEHIITKNSIAFIYRKC